MATMAEIEAYAPGMQDTASGPRFASVKIDSANLERVLSSRDGQYHGDPHPRGARDSGRSNVHVNVCSAANSLTFAKVSAYSQA